MKLDVLKVVPNDVCLCKRFADLGYLDSQTKCASLTLP